MQKRDFARRSFGRSHPCRAPPYRPRENMEYPRRYVRPVVHHAIIICHTDTRPRWGGVTARTLAARIISGRLPCVVVPYFLRVKQWIDFRYASPLPRLPRAGRYDIAPRGESAAGITPPTSTPRACAGKSRKGAKRPQDLPLRDFSEYATPYHQGVIPAAAPRLTHPAFYFR